MASNQTIRQEILAARDIRELYQVVARHEGADMRQSDIRPQHSLTEAIESARDIRDLWNILGK